MTKKYSVKPSREVQREQAKASWTPRVRQLGEVEPRRISVMEGKYEASSDKVGFIRPGALDFLSMPSRGFAT